MNSQRKECALPQRIFNDHLANVLITTGDHDEALIYQAPIGTYLGAYSMTVLFHEGSRLLERVRLFGPIKVTIEYSGGEKLSGELMLFNDHKSNPDGTIALMLQIHNVIDAISCYEQPIMPLT